LSTRVQRRGAVLPEWLDSLGHMKFPEYQRIVDQASDFFGWISAGADVVAHDRAILATARIVQIDIQSREAT
jgi:hypothetical protein